MRQVTQPVLAVILTIGLLAMMASPASAQSGTRGNPPSGSTNRTTPPAESGQRRQTPAPLALEGYCPVSLLAMKQWVKGNPTIQAVFDGHTYHFANEQGKQMFSNDLAKHVPVLGYEVAATKTSTPTSGSSSRQPARSGSSSR